MIVLVAISSFFMTLFGMPTLIKVAKLKQLVDEKKKDKKKKKKRRVSIQLKNNQFKAYKNSVRDLKRRKLKTASQSPQPRASILKKETEIQKAKHT